MLFVIVLLRVLGPFISADRVRVEIKVNILADNEL